MNLKALGQPEFYIGAGGVLATVLLFGKTTKLAFLSLRRLSQFLDDWFGEPAQHGHGPRMGIMERLQRIEVEVRYNGGESLKDKVTQLAREVDALRRYLEEKP